MSTKSKVSYLKRDGAWLKHTVTEDEEIFEGIFNPDTIGILENVTASPKEGEVLSRVPITTSGNPPRGSVVQLPPSSGVTNDFEFETTNQGIDELYKMDARVKLARADPRFSASERDRAGSSKLSELWEKAEKQLMRDSRRGISLPAFSMIQCGRCGVGINQYSDSFDTKNPRCPICGFDLNRVEVLGEPQ